MKEPDMMRNITINKNRSSMKGLPDSKIYELELKYWPYKASWKKVLEIICAKSPRNGTLLDIMCGPGYLLGKIALKRPDLKLTGMDIDKRYINYSKEKYPDLVEALKKYDANIEGAELYDDFENRIIETFKKLSEQDYKTIAIISHGGPIHCFFREILEKELEHLGDCAIIELDYNNGQYQIINMDNAELK
jgi:SAM-dependent methyltransferase